MRHFVTNNPSMYNTYYGNSKKFNYLWSSRGCSFMHTAQAAAWHVLAAHVLECSSPRCSAALLRLVLAGLHVIHAAHLRQQLLLVVAFTISLLLAGFCRDAPLALPICPDMS